MNDRLEELCIKATGKDESDAAPSQQLSPKYETLKRRLDTDLRQLHHLADCLVDDEEEAASRSSRQRSAGVRFKMEEIVKRQEHLERLWQLKDAQEALASSPLLLRTPSDNL